MARGTALERWPLSEREEPGEREARRGAPGPARDAGSNARRGAFVQARRETPGGTGALSPHEVGSSVNKTVGSCSTSLKRPGELRDRLSRGLPAPRRCPQDSPCRPSTDH
jgi:hypothetical protein